MKKLELKFGGIKEMLTKEQMKMISGGDSYWCGNGYGGGLPVTADNCCEAQGLCDAAAYSNSFTDMYPSGGDVPCDMVC